MGPKIQNEDYLENRSNNDEILAVFGDDGPKQNCIDDIFGKMTVHTVAPVDFVKTSCNQSDGFHCCSVFSDQQ